MVITGKAPARYLLGIQQFLESGDLDSVCWFSGLGSPAVGLTRVKSDAVALLRLVEWGPVARAFSYLLMGFPRLGPPSRRLPAYA